MRTARWSLLLMTTLPLTVAATTGCTGVEVTHTGPRITATLENSFYETTSDSSQPSLGHETNATTYSIDVTVTSQDGTEYNQVDTTAHPVTTVVATFAVPGTPIGDSTFDAMEAYGGDDFTRHDPIVIPATAEGQQLAVHIVAEDDDGLSSNVLDFQVLLE